MGTKNPTAAPVVAAPAKPAINVKWTLAIGRALKLAQKAAKVVRGNESSAVIARTQLAAAVTALDGAHTAMEKLPVTAFAKVKGSEIVVGVNVDVRVGRLLLYSGLLGADQIVSLKVLAVSGKTISCVTKKGTQIVLPLAYVKLSAPVAPVAAAA